MSAVEKFATFIQRGYRGSEDDGAVVRFVVDRVRGGQVSPDQASELFALLRTKGIAPPRADQTARELAHVGATRYGARQSAVVRHHAEGGNLLRFRTALASGAAGAAVDHRQLADPSQTKLEALCRTAAPRLVVELGTHTGASALAMSRGLAEGGRIITADVDGGVLTEAKRRWLDAGVSDKIECHHLPGHALLDELPTRYGAASVDFAFLDANFGEYPGYFDKLMNLLRPGGTLVIDDVQWWGLNEPLMYRWDTETQGFRTLLDAIEQRADPRIGEVRLHEVGQGLLEVRKGREPR